MINKIKDFELTVTSLNHFDFPLQLKDWKSK